MLTLSDVSVGEKVRITAFQPGADAYRHRLLAMGLTPGVIIDVAGRAPFDGPMLIKVRGYQLSLRSNECQQIVVEGIYDHCGKAAISSDYCLCR